jgi:hypothetical protein
MKVLLAGAAMALATGFAAGEARAGFAPGTVPFRTLNVSAVAESAGHPNPFPVTDEDVPTAPPPNPYTKLLVVTADADPSTPNNEVRASIEQTSTTDEHGFDIDGRFDHRVESDVTNAFAFAGARVKAQYVFDDPTSVAASIHGLVAAGGAQNELSGRLSRIDDNNDVNEDGQPDATTEIFTIDADGETFNGNVGPGLYELEFILRAGTTDIPSDFDGFYSFNTTFSGAGGSGGNPVPLPPAAWSALATMGLGAVAGVRRRFMRVA